VIFESSYWKDDLLKIAKRFYKRIYQIRWYERSLVNVEKDIFVGFYIVRKLIEAGKLSTLTENLKVNLVEYKSTGKTVTRYNRHKIEELYDLSNRHAVEVDIIYLCNQIVHSYIFAPGFSDESGELAYLLFCSDRKKGEGIYKIPINNVIAIFELVGNDYPDDAFSSYDEDKGDYIRTSYFRGNCSIGIRIFTTDNNAFLYSLIGNTLSDEEIDVDIVNRFIRDRVILTLCDKATIIINGHSKLINVDIYVISISLGISIKTDLFKVGRSIYVKLNKGGAIGLLVGGNETTISPSAIREALDKEYREMVPEAIQYYSALGKLGCI
jgi:hypothetical protein